MELANRKSVAFLEEIARIHISLHNLTYCTDNIQLTLCLRIATSFDLYKFLLMGNSSMNKEEAWKKQLRQFLKQKYAMFWKEAIINLPQRWQKLMEQNGWYIGE